MLLLIILMLMLLANSAVAHDIKSRIDIILIRVGFLVDVDVEWTITFDFGGSALELIWC